MDDPVDKEIGKVIKIKVESKLERTVRERVKEKYKNNEKVSWINGDGKKMTATIIRENPKTVVVSYKGIIIKVHKKKLI